MKLKLLTLWSTINVEVFIMMFSAAWLSVNALVLINVLCSTPGPVSTGMGDRSRVGLYHLGI